ncbi:DUF917 family protein [Salinibacterium sp. ZJ454]|uniref:S-methyl thiohydantoin desulfurase domain-containing protein n=1 Tax=Salinibacterium sp. ZJ454 TaxID=2708339 RepID=UPI0014244E7C|nr:DUF917 family protein [Salinibacterium sp. ZJ454]
MPRTLHRDALPALARGFSLLGAGGGGSPWLLELVQRDADQWPVSIHEVAELDPATPCLAVAYAGSTLLLAERVPGLAPFALGIRAIERWLGYPVPAVCSLEAAGMNGLAALPLAADRMFVDADLMGRALPDFDQLSITVDALPGLVVACPTGDGGVTLIDNARPDDLERMVRTAINCAGGWSGVVVGGFTVGDLAAHGILGTHARAQTLGAGYLAAKSSRIDSLAESIGATVIGSGRIAELQADRRDPQVVAIDVRVHDGDVIRIVSRSELLACLRNGRVEAAAPTIIVALDALSHQVLLVHELTVGRHIAVLSLPAPDWWLATEERRAHVTPHRWGLDGLEEHR